jgi:O-antigen/teichoic acid export membrane protein
LGLKGIILGYAFGYIVGDVIIALISHYRRYIDLSLIGKDVINKLIRYSYPLIPNSVSWWIMNVSDRFFINIFIGVAANGIYAIANKIPALCSAVFSVFNISWQQTAAEVVESGNTDEIANYFNRVFNVVLNKLLSICIGVMSCNFIFFNYIFDKKYFEGYLYSPILISAIIFMVMSTFYGGIQISLRMPKENGITTMAGAACNIVINVILINFLGLYAAAISTFCAYLLVEELRRIKLKNIVSFKLSKINLVSIIIFVYYLVCAYLIGYKILSWTNFILACIIFIYLNKDIFMLIWNKTLRVLRK